MIHVDVTTLANTSELGTAFVHTVTDDHSRVAYAEVHDDETRGGAHFGSRVLRGRAPVRSKHEHIR